MNLLSERSLLKKVYLTLSIRKKYTYKTHTHTHTHIVNIVKARNVYFLLRSKSKTYCYKTDKFLPMLRISNVNKYSKYFVFGHMPQIPIQ